MTTLQERRRDDLIKQIERTVARRELAIAGIIRMTKKIGTMGRQCLRYEKLIAAAPKPPVPKDKRRPAKELAKRRR